MSVSDPATTPDPKWKSVAVETQEAGTGRWFPILIYTPADETQIGRAKELTSALIHLGLYAASRLIPKEQSDE